MRACVCAIAMGHKDEERKPLLLGSNNGETHRPEREPPATTYRSLVSTAISPHRRRHVLETVCDVVRAGATECAHDGRVRDTEIRHQRPPPPRVRARENLSYTYSSRRPCFRPRVTRGDRRSIGRRRQNVFATWCYRRDVAQRFPSSRVASQLVLAVASDPRLLNTACSWSVVLNVFLMTPYII